MGNKQQGATKSRLYGNPEPEDEESTDDRRS
jgi:hypothetical protein